MGNLCGKPGKKRRGPAPKQPPPAGHGGNGAATRAAPGQGTAPGTGKGPGGWQAGVHLGLPFHRPGRWREIVNLLDCEINTPQQLVKIIGLLDAGTTHGKARSEQADLSGLSQYLNHMGRTHKNKFFNTTLPQLQYLVLDLPKLFGSRPIPLLVAQQANTVRLTRKQAAALVACEFFCLLDAAPDSFPTTTFIRVFGKVLPRFQIAKLRMVFNYFTRIVEEGVSTLKGSMLITRAVLSPAGIPNWGQAGSSLTHVNIHGRGFIEDATGCVQTDFANPHLGGGVLGLGNVQEEIRFCANTELLGTMLFPEMIDDNEAIVLVGAQRYNSYHGYGNTLTHDGDFKDKPVTRFPNQIHGTVIVALDALDFSHSDPGDQFVQENIHRELTKAYCGFNIPEGTAPLKPGAPVATGNWGCGVFKGNKQLKGMIQWLAASHAGRPLEFYAFGDNRFVAEFQAIANHCVQSNMSVMALYKLLMAHARDVVERDGDPRLFDYLFEQLGCPRPEIEADDRRPALARDGSGDGDDYDYPEGGADDWDDGYDRGGRPQDNYRDRGYDSYDDSGSYRGGGGGGGRYDDDDDDSYNRRYDDDYV